MIFRRPPPARLEAPRPDGASSLAGSAVSLSGARESGRWTAPALLAHLLAPVLVAAGCAHALALAGGATLERAGLFTLLVGVGLAYTVDRLREAPSGGARGRLLERHVVLVRVLALGFAAALAAAAMSLSSDRLPALGALGALVLVYPAAARIPCGKLASLAVAWALAATALPLTAPPPLAAVAALALLIAAAGLLCDIKDARSDARAGRCNLATRSGASVAVGGALALATCSALLAAHAGARGIEGGALALLVPCAWPGLLHRELAGPLAVDAALAAGLLLAA